jgi:serine O-acetyltransferase
MFFNEDLARYGRKGLKQALGAWVIYPGFAVCCYYRIFVKLHRKGYFGYWISMLLWRHVVNAFSCYISPLSQIGAGLQLAHATSVVIGEGVAIGHNVTIYQNVTIGKSHHTIPGYPIIEDDVSIYAGATIIGPVTIGKGATIAAHALVNCDVPAFTTAIGSPARIVRKKFPTPSKQNSES